MSTHANKLARSVVMISNPTGAAESRGSVSRDLGPSFPHEQRRRGGRGPGGLVVAALLSVLVVACDGGGSGGEETGEGGAGATGAGVRFRRDMCGGLAGFRCAPDEYCDFPDDAACGAGDQTGTCRDRPEICTLDCPGVCGCDGQFYCNACIAASAGVDVDPDGSCSPPGNVCGGLQGGACAPDEYCDFPDEALCGAADQTGICQPRPQVCTLDCPGVCGCDDQFYCNACEAAAVGVDVSPGSSCTM